MLYDPTDLLLIPLYYSSSQIGGIEVVSHLSASKNILLHVLCIVQELGFFFGFLFVLRVSEVSESPGNAHQYTFPLLLFRF